MHSKTAGLFYLLFTSVIFQASIGYDLKDKDSSSVDKGDSASAVNTSEVDSLDDRFNLNFNLAQAQGFGRFGGHSQSNALSYGVNAGIRGPTGHYQNLFSRTGANSHGFSTGPGAPLTFANSASRVRPGHAGGNAAAGVFGGRGSSRVTSQTQNFEIPLDGRGTVLLTNLKAPSNSSNDDNSSEPATTPEETTENAPIVFS